MKVIGHTVRLDSVFDIVCAGLNDLKEDKDIADYLMRHPECFQMDEDIAYFNKYICVYGLVEDIKSYYS